MNIKIGCDIVNIKKFTISLNRGGDNFLNKIFSTHELLNCKTPENLAGFFAVKEAVKKALELNPDDWKKIEIIKKANGRPQVKLIGIKKPIISNDISISHDEGYAMATAVFVLNDSCK